MTRANSICMDAVRRAIICDAICCVALDAMVRMQRKTMRITLTWDAERRKEFTTRNEGLN